ncbi:hypothetical protein M404DRAFT_994712 [Pisolithus tinctorius Marx 270]|uniref:Uncharacterized protein n=1 Tax=Pisolithus tinctorius Marx 270 TaxID=870435 RepID=A0A0C3PR47_PISTI|nr:hypothetical protein M404DRAFT_994712 [Pisolithus tinctorius Marx 270]
MCPQEGLSERDERPEKREEWHRTVRATAAGPRGDLLTKMRIPPKPLRVPKHSWYPWKEWTYPQKREYLLNGWAPASDLGTNRGLTSSRTSLPKSERHGVITSEIHAGYRQAVLMVTSSTACLAGTVSADGRHHVECGKAPGAMLNGVPWGTRAWGR